ncbi:ABC transporter ATP-binding protein [Acidobacteriota bacterium]
MSAVKTEDLTKTFDRLQAIHNINLDISRGELIGLIGPDGAGKTTLLRLLVGLLNPTSGRVWIEGIDMSQNQRKIKNIIGYMPQHFSLYGDLTVSENMKFFSDLYKVPRDQYEERKKELLQFSALAPFQKRLARNLSGGMQKKLALSCNLFHTPDILFLDEPTTGVDPVSRKELWDYLFTLKNQGKTLIVSTPYMDEAQKCHRVALIYEGHILALADPEELINNFTKTIIEITSDQKNARTTLKTMPSLQNIYPYAGSLHLTFNKGTDGVEITKAFCLAQNIEVKSIKKIDPSFEDTFLDFISKQ